MKSQSTPTNSQDTTPQGLDEILSRLAFEVHYEWEHSKTGAIPLLKGKKAILGWIDREVLNSHNADWYFIKDKYANEVQQEAYEHGASDAIHDIGEKQRAILRSHGYREKE